MSGGEGVGIKKSRIQYSMCIPELRVFANRPNVVACAREIYVHMIAIGTRTTPGPSRPHTLPISRQNKGIPREWTDLAITLLYSL